MRRFWGWLLFGIPFHIISPALFALSVVLSIFSVALVGFLLSVVVVRYRTAWALGNMLEYPGWLLCGFLIPLTVLPAWVLPISYALPPTWGMRAIRSAAAGGSPWAELGICLGLGIGYGVVAALLSETVLRSARRNATLSLT
ncbi:MAG TPA: ABC transporter permease [Nocardioidaceae bacterium]|nr:ABC transporter permease [Nocardioidaceae bacterium]